jgi:hypothetical protein
MTVVEFPNTVERRREEERLAWYRDFGHRLRAARLARGISGPIEDGRVAELSAAAILDCCRLRKNTT